MSKSKNNLYAVILAGGSGTRFWPLSRKKKPKQFIDIQGQGSLLQETLARIQSKIPGKNVYIVTGAIYKKEILSQVKKYKVPAKNILLEPNGKNTAPAIGWAAALIHKQNPDAVLAVLPSDHLISNKRKYLSALNQAVQLAQKEYLVTMGIKPTRPETGYGYLKTSKKRIAGKTVVVVDQFKEKPTLPVAKKFVKQGNYYWNSGMFIWRADVILNEFKMHIPKLYRYLAKGSSQAYIKKVWNKFPSISIDYGILEKAKKVGAIPAADIGWSDLGSWESLFDVLAKKKKDVVKRGDAFDVESKASLVWSSKKFVATIGLDNLVVVDTDDALLICQKDRSQDVRQVVEYLKSNRRPEL